MTTIEEVRTNFESGLQAVFILDQALAAELLALRRKVFNRKRKKMSSKEDERRKEIYVARMELAEAMEALALDHIFGLESALGPEIDILINGINEVNKKLKCDLKHLKSHEKHASKIETVFATLSKIVDNLKKMKKAL